VSFGEGLGKKQVHSILLNEILTLFRFGTQLTNANSDG